MSHSGTAASDCSSKPVYAATPSPKHTDKAGMTRMNLGRNLGSRTQTNSNAVSASNAVASSQAPAVKSVGRGLRNSKNARSVIPRSEARQMTPIARSAPDPAQAGTNTRERLLWAARTSSGPRAIPSAIMRSGSGTSSIITLATSSNPAPLPPRNRYQTGISPSMRAPSVSTAPRKRQSKQ